MASLHPGAEQSSQAYFFTCLPPPAEHPHRPPTSPHSFFLRMHKTCGYLGESALPEFPVAPSGGTGAGGGGRHTALGPAAGRQGGAQHLESETVPRGGECCSRSPCCILISAAAATPRGRPSIFHTKGRPPGPPQSPPHCSPRPPITAEAVQSDREGGRQTHRQGPKDPGNSSQDPQSGTRRQSQAQRPGDYK